MVDNIFLKCGLCPEVLADLGKEFEAELQQELLRILGINLLKTSGYRPQTNGACEVWHRTLNSMLTKVVKDSQKDWSEWVPFVTFCYNATVHSATGFSPFFIFTGREPLWNIDFLLPHSPDGAVSVPEYVATVVQRLEEANTMVREHLRIAAESASR